MKLQPIAYAALLAAAGCGVLACTGTPVVDGIAVVREHLSLFSARLSAALQDGLVTPEEAALIEASFKELGGQMTLAIESAARTNWAEVFTTAGIAIVTTLLGVKVLPERALRGPFDAKN